MGANADVILRYEPSDKGLPYLKVKLIQKKGGAFPVVTLKKSLTLTGSKPGAVLKQYDIDWIDNPVTVLEMDGEIDMSKMDSQLKEIESNLVGLNPKSPTELSETMEKLKSSPGSDNGTGLMQTIIAMKVREVYEKMTGKTTEAQHGAENSVPTGLTWPSPEAVAKLREVDGIRLYPTHAWTDSM